MTWRPRRLWAWPSELRRAGVLGINRRNAGLLMPLNPRALYPRVDDKAITKEICHARGVPTPQTYAIIRRFGEIAHLDRILDNHSEFVIKPGRGAAGRGVLVIAGRNGQDLATSSGSSLTLDDARYHVSSILSGLYSLEGHADCAIVEERIRPHPVFNGVCFGGTPDIRVIVCRFEPVMCMLRLPTRQSRGRANLHQGAVGAGVDMATGVTLGGVLASQPVDLAPDTGRPIAGVQIPSWPQILETATRLSRALELGYVGVDIVLDERRGPVVLEANARPGLAIQTANRRGLLHALGLEA
ncbi:MAG TPA: alpha-L-glutamate ligase-like protein [Candidatus Brocadiia bacterium]|nr:alpha-L-glutamate ligase-like protein [Candidatus Brocadiia bacterium]